MQSVWFWFRDVLEKAKPEGIRRLGVAGGFVGGERNIMILHNATP